MRDHPRAPSPEGDTSTQGEATQEHMTRKEVAGQSWVAEAEAKDVKDDKDDKDKAPGLGGIFCP